LAPAWIPSPTGVTICWTGCGLFEVDHPASQRWKRRRLAELGVDSPTGLVFTPVDFERQTLREGMAEAGFNFRSWRSFPGLA
jgi:O-methyltransferase involved in polyketide biosynthesis